MFKPFSTVITGARVAVLVSGIGVAAALGAAPPPSAFAMPIDHRCETLMMAHEYYQSVILDPYSTWQEALVAARNDNELIANARASGCDGI
jgi:hypothetical protein